MPTDLLDLLGPPGGAAAAGRTMARAPAAPVLFSGLLFADSGLGRTMELGRSARPTFPVQLKLKTERFGMAYRLLFVYGFVHPESEQNCSLQ
jgi:hypothetical protein